MQVSRFNRNLRVQAPLQDKMGHLRKPAFVQQLYKRLHIWRWGQNVPSKHRYKPTKLYGVKAQKTTTLTITAVRTSEMKRNIIAHSVKKCNNADFLVPSLIFQMLNLPLFIHFFLSFFFLSSIYYTFLFPFHWPTARVYPEGFRSVDKVEGSRIICASVLRFPPHDKQIWDTLHGN